MLALPWLEEEKKKKIFPPVPISILTINQSQNLIRYKNREQGHDFTTLLTDRPQMHVIKPRE